MNIWHPWQLKKSKSWELFWIYQLICTDNPVLIVLINLEIHNGNFGFPGLRSFNSDKDHWDLSPYIFVTYYLANSWRDFVDETGTNNDVLYFFTFFSNLKQDRTILQIRSQWSKPVNISLKLNILRILSFGLHKDIYKLVNFCVHSLVI